MNVQHPVRSSTSSCRITWDLMVERGKRDDASRFTVARVEPLYPQPTEAIKEELARYPNLKMVRWVQDEPLTMGPPPRVVLAVGGHDQAPLEAQ